MECVKLGNTGLDVPPICLGCMSFGTTEGWVHDQWSLNEEDSRTIIKRALDL
jgi:aryl-alcohol dehydrogenase-like predicted oxidoreductase